MVYGILGRLFLESCPACGLASGGGFCDVCAAENVTRSRDVPGGTVGGRIALTRNPASRSAAATSVGVVA